MGLDDKEDVRGHHVKHLGGAMAEYPARLWANPVRALLVAGVADSRVEEPVEDVEVGLEVVREQPQPQINSCIALLVRIGRDNCFHTQKLNLPILKPRVCQCTFPMARELGWACLNST